MRNSFTVTTTIQASPSQVFRFLADPSTASVIDPVIRSYEPEGGTMGLGVRNHIRMKLLGIPVPIISETRAWDQDQRMVFRSTKPNRPVIAVATHLMEEHPEGTLYSWSMEFVATGIGGRILAPIAARIFERNALAQQARLRIVLNALTRLSVTAKK